jgi:hypothetical protein
MHVGYAISKQQNYGSLIPNSLHPGGDSNTRSSDPIQTTMYASPSEQIAYEFVAPKMANSPKNSDHL